MTTGLSDIENRAEAFRARAVDIDALVPLGRLGWVAKGIVYALVGILAVPIAFGGGGGGGEEASRQGAVAEIAETSYGPILLWLLAIGLVLYALWRLVTAVLPGDNDLDTWAHRAAYFFSAIVYGFLAWSAISFATSAGGGQGGGSGGSGGSTLEQVSRTLMEATAGRWLLGLGALAGLGVAGYFGYKAYDNRFLDELDLGGASKEERDLIEYSGTAGWIGRAITTALLSIFVLQAAITADPDEAKGLDGALREIAGSWWGTALVLVAGLGLIAYGIFAAVSARRRLLLGP